MVSMSLPGWNEARFAGAAGDGIAFGWAVDTQK